MNEPLINHPKRLVYPAYFKTLARFAVMLLAVMFLAMTLLEGVTAHARNFNLDGLKTLPIQHEGRLKPLDSFARLMLTRFSGHERPDGIEASAWLAESLFDPARAAARPVFALGPAAVEILYPEDSRRPAPGALVSYTDLAPRLLAQRDKIIAFAAIPPEKLSAAQKALLDTQRNFIAHGQIMRALTPVLPLALTLPAHLRGHETEAETALSYTDLLRLRPRIEAGLEALIRRKGDNISAYSGDELHIVRLSLALDQVGAGGTGNALFAVIPPLWDGIDPAQDDPAWQSPWHILTGGQGSPEGARLLGHWRAMGIGWQSGDAARWNAALDALHTDLDSRPRPGLRPFALQAEAVYQDFKPYRWTMGLYAGVLALMALAVFRPRLAGWSVPSALRLLALAIILHLAAITARTVILERPPVGTLYESVLFVALVAALAGLMLSLRLKTVLPAGAGAGAALGLLAVAPVTIADSSNFDVLGAVLNTNFWLATHVLIITAGYGFCVVTSVLAHIRLAYIRRPARSERDGAGLGALCYRLSLAALLLTCVGTILGGIWADQSWGRFWGWDPKENGALLIVLWLVWLQHGRLSGHVGERGFAAGLAFLNVIVALSWFGVNLLGVGLHSYGFTSGLAAGLFAFCTAELFLIGVLWYRSCRC